MSVIRQEQVEQEVLQRGILFLVSEGRLHHLPEGSIEIELFDLAPNGGHVVEVELGPYLDPGMENCPHQIEEFRVAGLARTTEKRIIYDDINGGWGICALRPLPYLSHFSPLSSWGLLTCSE